jgi:chromosomal replication initiation ATPase DnaA
MICPHCGKDTRQPAIDADKIIDTVCRYFEIVHLDLAGRHCNYANRLIAYFLRKSGYTLVKIGEKMNRHYTSIIYKVGVVKKNLDKAGQTKADVENINKLLEEN